ncbi:MAG: hypothetical protein E5Y10_24995 [Mesorhizobium sp.]|uniref:Uncharacterized protein n=1 Tax=Mesorhizobium delmotii TaxID=1631247 RepID=A0A2P9APE5_9HYPH|nr:MULTISPECIES: hypothetical protein [Mesorhizobium]TIN38841.1 MAG: hypothetical protein E5Y13_15415 [Mesorhizobium sp.]TJU85680.1 MAG: hypothetical protein E5Y10_24995 [Mesorhizobium sp.]SJM33030.1 hypothetical protein BQ8482_330165 [Mesorhizobium delmotii]
MNALKSISAYSNVFELQPSLVDVAFRPQLFSIPRVKRQMEELLRLSPGWDGYNGIPSTSDNIYFAISVLESTCGPTAPAPQIVPGASGDLQIEWHVDNADIELHVRAPYDVHAWRQSAEHPDGEELFLSTDFDLVAGWIQEISEPTDAVSAAAA